MEPVAKPEELTIDNGQLTMADAAIAAVGLVLWSD
jgi:hypothetical protein